MIDAIVARGGVIGATLGNWQIHRDWSVGRDDDADVTLLDFVDHIDHICQLAGNAESVAIGSDLDGGVGFDEFPTGIDTVADLQAIATVLAARGYDDQAIEGIMHRNWLRFLRGLLPPSGASSQEGSK
jgi:membrane dipeptidase